MPGSFPLELRLARRLDASVLRLARRDEAVLVTVVLIAVLLLILLLLGLGRRGRRRAVDLIDELARDLIYVRAHRGGEVRVLDGGAQVVGGVRGVARVPAVEVRRHAAAGLGGWGAGAGAVRGGWPNGPPPAGRPAAPTAKGRQG